MALRGVSTCALFQGGPRGWWSGCTPEPRLKVPGVGLEQWPACPLHRLQTLNQLGLAIILPGQDTQTEPHRAICDPGSGPWAHQATWPGQAMVTGVAQVGVGLGLPHMPKVPYRLSMRSRAHCVWSPGLGTCLSLLPLPQLGPRSGLGENTSALKRVAAGIRKRSVRGRGSPSGVTPHPHQARSANRYLDPKRGLVPSPWRLSY